MRRLARFVRRNEWVLISTLIVLSFCAGCLGHIQLLALEGPPGRINYWDIVYSSLQLFILEGPEETPGWPTYLQVVRLVAPFLLIYAAVKTVWMHVGTHMSLFLLRFRRRRFVVICGIGETGERLARDYLTSSGQAVVLIDRQEENPRVAALKQQGAIFVQGDALNSAVLIRARVFDAREMFLFTGDEESNIGIAKQVHRLLRPATADKPYGLPGRLSRHIRRTLMRRQDDYLSCYLEVDSPDIYELFQAHPFFGLITMSLRIRIFNRDENIARNVFADCAPDLYRQPKSSRDRPLNVLFFGFGSLVREMLIQLALTAHYADQRIPRASVICSASAREEVEKFQRRFLNLDQVVDISFIYQNPMTLDAHEWAEIQQLEAFSVCYCALDDDVQSILAARRVNRIHAARRLPKLHFVVCLNQQTWIADVVDDVFAEIIRDKSQLPAAEPIEYFETLDRTITIDVIVNHSLDKIARVIHDEYLATQLASAPGELPNESVVDWEDLPRHKRVANQRAADHLDVKLRVIGCSRGNAEMVGDGFVFSESEVELLAKIEHQRWMADKFLAGYVYGEQRDEVTLCHPDLKPWESLSESDRDKDRQNVLLIPKLLEILGQSVQRAKDAHDATENIELQVQSIH